MATNFPTSLDTLTNPATSDQLSSPSHASQHANANDAIEQLEAKVGANGSAVTTSHDYKIAQLEAAASDVQNSLGDYIPLNVLGQPSGPAQLNADGNLIVPENKIIIEGATADAHELTLQAPDVTSDITVTLPNFSGTLATTVDVSNLGTLKSNTTNPSFVINGSPTVFEPSWSAVTFTGSSSGLVVITSTQIASYASNHFAGDEIQFNFGSGHPWFNANGTYTIISHFTSGESQEYFYLSEFNFIPQSGFETMSYAGPSSIWFNVYPDSKNISSTEIGYLDGVTSGIQNQINLKSNIDSPTFTGTPLAPTASAATNTTQIATTAFVSTAVSNLVNSAPGTLDTLNELATALGNDANFATTTATSIGNKVSKAGGDVIQSSLSSVIPLVLKGAASQTANLQEWQDSAGNLLGRITSTGITSFYGGSNIFSGDVRAGTSSYLVAALSVAARVATESGLVVRGFASQTADLQQWQNSAGTVLSRIREDGTGFFPIVEITRIFAGGIPADWTNYSLYSYSTAANRITLGIQGNASQTADLTQWQNSAGTVLAKVDASGQITSTASDHYFSSSAAYRPNIHITNTNADSNGSYILFEKSRAGSAVVANDVLGVLNFTGFDTATYAGSAIIYGVAEGTFSPTSRPGKLVFATVPNGSTTMTNRMTIANSGTVTINGFGAAAQGLIVKAAASQTANLLEFQNSGGTAVTFFNASGGLTATEGVISTLYSGGKMTTGTLGYYNATTFNPSVIPVVVRGAASQTADLQQWQSSTGSVGAYVASDGSFITRGSLIGGSYSGSALFGVQSYSTTQVVAVVKGAASQTANLQEWQNSAGDVLLGIDSTGSLNIGAGSSNMWKIKNQTSTVMEWQPAQGFMFLPYGASNRPVTIKGAASQTANLTEWHNSDGVVLSSVGPNGTITLKSVGGSNIANFYNGTNGYGAGSITSGGTFNINGANIGFPYTSSGAMLSVNATSATGVPITSRGYASQTADLQQWQNSAGTILARVNQNGAIVTSAVAVLGAQTSIADTELSVYSTVATQKGIVIKGFASQTANLQEWQDSAGTALAVVSNVGTVRASIFANLTGGLTYIATNFDTSGIGIVTLTAAQKGLIVRGFASQTANLQEWQNSAGTVLANVSPAGKIAMKHINGISGDMLSLGSNGASDILVVGYDNISAVTYINGGSYGPIQVQLNSAANGKFVIKGAASQTANLQEWRDINEAVLASVSASGSISAVDLTLSGNLTVNGTTTNLNSTNLVIEDKNIIIADVATPTDTTADGAGITIKGATDKTLTWVNSTKSFTSSEPFIINTNSTARPGLIVKAIGLQTANIQEWQDSNGNVAAAIASTYAMSSIAGGFFGTATGPIISGNYLAVRGWASNHVPFIVKGFSAQTGDLTRWVDDSNATLAKVDSSGNVTAADYRLSNSLYSVRKNIKKVIDPASSALANNTYDLFGMNFSSSLQGTFYIQVSIRGGGYGQNMTYSLPATYVMDWISQYGITNPFTDSTTWVDLTPFTFSPRHLMTTDYLKFQARVSANTIFFRIKLTGALTGSPVFDVYMQHSEEFANSTITELFSTGTDATVSNVMPNFLSSKAGLSAIFNPLTITASVAANVPLTIKGTSSQTANIQEWQNSAGSVLTSVSPTGKLTITNTSASAALIEVLGAGGGQFTVSQNGGISTNGGFQSIGASSYFGGYGGASNLVLNVTGASGQTGDLQRWTNFAGTILAKVDSLGNFTATSKSFDIEHPTKENMRLRYGSLEGPENGVYVRGTVESNIIELPDYWTGLVHADSITVSLTSVGSAQNIYVEKIENNKIYIGGNLEKAFFTVYGERKDIDNLTVEY